jgi:HIRAN domain
MTVKRIHMSGKHGTPVCGVRSADPQVSNDPEAINCKNCLAKMAPLGTFNNEFFSKIAGVTHDNADGTSRQAIISRCNVGERLVLQPEPDNSFDPNAVKVLRTNGEQLGFLGARLAAELQPYLIAGQTIPCCIANFSGGEYETGVNIYIGAWVSTEQGGAAGTLSTFIKPEAKPAWGLLFLFVAILIVIAIIRLNT